MLLLNVLLCLMGKPEVLPQITHLAKLPLTPCEQERCLEVKKDSHVSVHLILTSLCTCGVSSTCSVS